MECSQCREVQLCRKSNLLVSNFLPHSSCLSSPGTHADSQSDAHKTLKEHSGKWFFPSYMCLMQQFNCSRNDSKLLTQIEWQDVLYVTISTLNQASDGEFGCHFLCSLEYNSAQTVVKVGFRQKSKEGGVSGDGGIKHLLPSDGQLAP